MGEDIGLPVAETEKRQQHDAAGDRSPIAQSGKHASTSPIPPQCGEQADACEYRGRGSDECVGWRPHQGVQEITGGSGCHHGERGHSGTEDLGQKQQENCSEGEIAQKMNSARMQKQCGECAPPFAGADQVYPT